MLSFGSQLFGWTIVRKTTLALIIVSCLGLIFLWRLGDLTPGLNSAWTLLVSLSAVSIDAPGAVWLLVVGGFIARRQLLAATRRVQQPYLIISSLIGIVIISPLIVSSIGDLTLPKALFLWPDHW